MLDGYIRDFAQWTPRAPAVVLPGRVVSYAEFDADVDRIGALLADLGVGPGCGIVALRMDDTYLHRLSLAALSRLGAVSSPAADAQADVQLLHGAPQPLDGPHVLRLEPEQVAQALSAPHRPLPRRIPEPDALVRVMLSSGTTATPKRVGFSWQRLELATLTNIRVYGAGRLGLWLPMTGADSLLGFSMIVAAWALGAAGGVGFRIEEMPAVMERHPGGVAVLTPTGLATLIHALPHGFEPKPGWRLQVGGSALPAAMASEARLRITPDVWTGYGATESSRVAATPAAAVADLPGGVGVVPAGAIVEIVDETGRGLPDGESGEIRVRSTRTAEGYLDDPDTTADRFQDGWYHTRDVGRRLPDGRLVIEGRIDDRMNLGGVKFMPALLENPVREHPGVADCAAFAVPDAEGLDSVFLALVVEEGFDRERLMVHIARDPDLPKPRLVWIDEIPRNAMGKVERDKLRAAVLEAMAGSTS